MQKAEKLLLLLRLGLSLLCAVINGIDLSFNVYAVTLKETFNFTQTQVEITASMSSIGFGLAFSETLISGFCGYGITLVITWLALVLSSGLFSLVAFYNSFSHSWPVLVYAIQLCLSTGNGVCHLTVSHVCLQIIPERHMGLFIGTFGAAICFGKIFFAGLFELFFIDDLVGFFQCLTLLFAVVIGLCYITLYTSAKSLKQNRPADDETVQLTKSDGNQDYRSIMRSSSFHMTFWTTSVFSAAGYTMLNNITSVTDSLTMSSSAFAVVTTMSVCIMATRLISGFVFDRVSTQFGGFWMLFVSYISLGIGMLLGMYALNQTTVYFLAILSAVGVGPAYFLPVTMLVAQFGRQYYGAICGALCAITGVCILSLQVLVGFLYDTKATQMNHTEKDHFCYGPECFFAGFAVMLSITVLAAAVQALNLYCIHITTKS